MEDVVIVAATRTAIGSFGGTLARRVRGTRRCGDPRAAGARQARRRAVDEVIMGQVLQAGCGQNPARQSVDQRRPAASGAGDDHQQGLRLGPEGAHLATQAIRCGDAEIVIAGGQENMSLSPHVLPGSRDGLRMGDWKMIDSMINDGLWDIFNQYHMGITAENVAKKYGVTREEQDAFAAARSRRPRRRRRPAASRTKSSPFRMRRRATRWSSTLTSHQRTDHRRRLAALRPAFDKAGTVTAGNASGINDGAAAVIMSRRSQGHGPGPDAAGAHRRLRHAGLDPAIMGMGPVPAARTAWSAPAGAAPTWT